MKLKCPYCGKKIELENNPYKPFCSKRCKLLDLDKWLSENYRIPSEDNKPEQKEKEPEE